MDSFSISQLSQYSGIRSHTIRIWEQRYHALSPHRTKGNTRYYDNQQLRRLLNIVSLIGSGHKVSALCTMSDAMLFNLVSKTSQAGTREAPDYLVSQLIAAGANYDEQHFEKIFSHGLARYGIRDGYIKVIYPLLERLGLLWTTDALAAGHEHFISNLIRQKLYTSLDALPPPVLDSGSWLLFLPENELHDIGLLFANYLIRSSGRKTIYLGSNVPFESVKSAGKITRADNLLLFFVLNDSQESIQKYLKRLGAGFNGNNIYVAINSRQTGGMKPGKKIHLLHSVEDMEKELLP